MKIAVWLYLALSFGVLLRVIYELVDCLVSYKYAAVDTYGYLNSKFLWLLVFTAYILASLAISIATLVALRKKKHKKC